jgi:hypothetical protein
MSSSFDTSKIKILRKFRIRKKYGFSARFKEKDICLAYDVHPDTLTKWELSGFWKCQRLLTYLEHKHKKLDNFELILFECEEAENFYEIRKDGVINIYLNYPKFVKYCRHIDKFLRKLKVIEYSDELRSLINEKIARGFFENVPIEILEREVETTNFKLIEKILSEFDNLSDEEKKKLLEKLEHSEMGSKIIEPIVNKYKNLDPNAPEIQLKLFIGTIDRLGSESTKELLQAIVKSKISTPFIRDILKSLESEPKLYHLFVDWLPKLSLSKKIALLSKLPDMVKLYDRFRKLKRSRDEFKRRIEEEVADTVQKEKEIHQFLIDNYWLLGIEYFNKRLLSDIDETGQRTEETRMGRLRPDIIIESIDGEEDLFKLIELEAINDKIFNDDGTLSPKVFDGINQVIRYVIETRIEGKYSKGIAVIGSTSGMNLDEKQKTRLILLEESFHNVEIWTYEDILRKANSTIAFFESYEAGQRNTN